MALTSSVSFLVEEVQEEVDGVVTWGDDDKDEVLGPNVSNQLSQTENKELSEMLQRFPDILRSKPGRTTIIEHTINVGAAQPIKLPPYCLPHAYQDTVKEELREMEQQGIIERSSSEWAAPIVLVKKKDGTLYMCIDYKQLNAVSDGDTYKMPIVDDLIDCLGKAKYITTLDLSCGYWQVPVNEGSRPLTAFTTPYGLFQFKVMPFGLQGAPATFQRMMDELLRDMDGYAAAYLDDVVIHSELG